MGTASYPGYGEVLHFGRLGGAGDAELLHVRFGRFDFARHAHDRVSFGLITSGAMRLEQAGGSLVARAGDVMLYDHDRVHWGGSERGSGWTVRSLYADPGRLAALARQCGFRQRGTIGFPTPVVRDGGMARRLLALHRAAEAGAPRLETETLMLEVIVAAIADYGDGGGDPAAAGAEPRAVRRARDYLEARVGEDVALEELAAAAGLSASRLARVFKRETGLPPHAYHGYLRVRRAQALLRDGMTVAATAAECGFVDQAHLTRAFKRHVGLTPGRFRAA
jgi:AraC-like DNA-binding protein